MKKYLILCTLLFAFFANVLFGQIMCLPDQNPVWASERARLSESFKNGRARSPSDFKVVRINYHFVLRSDGTGNFTETGDNRGNPLNGYQFAKDITSAMNSSLSYNPQMIIPPNNTIPANNKNYAYVVDAVYFHRNNSWFNFGSGPTLYNTVGADKSTVMNIFFTHGTGTAGGYAVDLPHNPTTPKWTENQAYYKRYVDYLNQVVQGDQYGWVMHGLNKNTGHELGHLLGLSHTVQYNSEPACPTVADGGTVDITCDDGCDDTPTAWYMRDILNAPRHPYCGWVNATTPWCSNNMMDYNADYALTPCQLNIIHAGLDGGLKNYKTCEAVKTDNSLCDIGYPKLAYFGKVVTIGCNGSTATLAANEEAHVYFSNEVILNPIEINGDFDVTFQATCN
jgi:hypothetical protein